MKRIVYAGKIRETTTACGFDRMDFQAVKAGAQSRL